MTIASIMTAAPISVDMDDSLEHVAQLFEKHHFHHVLVVDGRSKVVGVISDRDVLRNLSPFAGKLAERPQDADTLKRRAHQLMSRGLVSISADAAIEDAADRMLATGISCLPVLDADGHARGIVTWRDLLRALVNRA